MKLFGSKWINYWCSRRGRILKSNNYFVRAFEVSMLSFEIITTGQYANWFCPIYI